MIMLRLILAALMVLGLLAGPATAGSFTPISAEDQTTRMGRGVNIIGYDPYWQDGGKGNYEDRHFKAIKDAGFSTVRVVLFTFPHMDAQNQISETWLKKLDWVVDTALKHDLNVILDEHDFTDCSRDAAVCETKLTAVWRQIAPRYQDRSNRVIFEILNEPHDKLDAATWNALFPKVLAVIRATNPQRNVILGGTQWNSRNTLKDLKLPDNDLHLIATFHYYDPFNFTHQGASWAPPEITALKGLTWGSDAQRAQIDADFDAVKAWSDANKRPILLGEFGAYDKAPLESRIVWTDAVTRAAEKRGFAWTYWQFSSDFIVWDFANDDWNRPILGALIPDSPALSGKP
ncbi:hypothetical protein ABAC402_17300 [Asticcacaulis sp. AC402]|nr:hypothetical protein ABAC402_17300 [Asticcacaulis sp. AC402]